MGVEPDQADLLLLLAVVIRQARESAHRYRVVAPENHGHASRFQHADHGPAKRFTGLPDLLEVLEARITGAPGLLDLDVQVSRVLDVVAEGAKLLVHVGTPERRRPHVDSAPSGPEVEGHADQCDLALLHRPRMLHPALTRGHPPRRYRAGPWC